MRNWLLLLVVMSGVAVADEPRVKIGEKLTRRGDEIMVCGQLYHTTTRVVLWTDPGGYDAYRVEPGAAGVPRVEQTPAATAEPRRATRFGLRRKGLTPDNIEKVRGGGWDLPPL